MTAYMRSGQKQEYLKSKITSATGIPEEVVLGASVINILGYRELCIENYRGILEYTYYGEGIENRILYKSGDENYGGYLFHRIL